MRAKKLCIVDNHGELYVIPDDAIEDFVAYDADGNEIFDEDIGYAEPRFLKLNDGFYSSRMTAI